MAKIAGCRRITIPGGVGAKIENIRILMSSKDKFVCNMCVNTSANTVHIDYICKPNQ